MEGWLVAFPKPAVIEEVTICLTRPGVAARIGRWRCTTKGTLSSSSGILRRVSRSSRHVQNVYLNRLDLHITQTIVCASPSHTVSLIPLLLLHFCFGSLHFPCHAVLPWYRSLGSPGLTAVPCRCFPRLARRKVPQQEGHNCSL